MKDRILDLVFLVGVLFKGIDGLGELIGGAILLFIGQARLTGMANAVTAHALSQDPDDTIANFIRHEAAHLGDSGVAFLAIYLLLHGIVKVAIVVALLVGSRRIYPWAVAALVAFVLFQLYELVTTPSVGFVLLTIFDLVIVWLTWREWRRDRELRDTWRDTFDWVFRRHHAPDALPNAAVPADAAVPTDTGVRRAPQSPGRRRPPDSRHRPPRLHR